MTWWVWVIVGVFLCVAEIATPGAFYLLFFGISALLVGFLAWSNLVDTTWIQILLFSIISIISLIVFRRWLNEKLNLKEVGGQIHTIEGEIGTAMESIPSGGSGKVEVRGSNWNAVNQSDGEIEQGQKCIIEQVKGVSLWAKGA